MAAFLGIDVGTSSTKCLLIEAGQELARGRCAYSVSVPRQGFAQQSPMIWWDAVIRSAQECLKAVGDKAQVVQGIGITGQMHGLVMLDASGAPVADAILWPDQRSAVQVKQLAQVFGEQMTAVLGGPVASGFLLPSLVWIKENRPDLYCKIHRVVTPKDYVRYRLTGQIAVDPTDACGTGAFAPAGGGWVASYLSSLGIDPELFPEIKPSAQVSGELLPDAATALGLTAGIPVVTGCGDTPASALGMGIVSDDQLLVNVGTGGQVLQRLSRYRFDAAGRLHVMSYPDGTSWYAMGAMLAAGLSLTWLTDLLGVDSEEQWQRLWRDSADVCACEEELFFLPYLVGERTPYMQSSMRGSFVGLRSSHRREHLFRAVVEGVGFALYDCYQVLSEIAPMPTAIRSGGSTVKQDSFRHVLADVFGLPVYHTEQAETSAFGAAMLAASAITEESLAEVAQKWVRIMGVTYPGSSQQRYREGFAQFRELADQESKRR